jgi:hypothetical protein
MIDRIRVKNILANRHVDTRCTPLTVIGGTNEGGKTSLLQAIRFAVDGTLPRVSLIKDAPLVVSDGAEDGRIELYFSNGDSFQRDLPSRKESGTLPPEFAYASVCSLDPHFFAHMTPDQRRKALFEVTGTKASAEWVTERLKAENIPEGVIASATTMLRSGFDAACTHASTQMTHYKGIWEGITGEKYGPKKALTWAATVPDADTRSVEDVQTDIGVLDEALKRANEAVGVAKQAQGFATLPSETDLAAKRGELQAYETRLEKLRAELAEAQKPTESCNVDVCPHCKEAIAIVANTPYVPGTEPGKPKPGRKVAEIQRDIAAVEKSIGPVRTELADTAAKKAAAEVFNLDRPDVADLATVQAEATRLAEALEGARATLRDVLTAAADRTQAIEATDKAKNAHLMVATWDLVRGLFSPAGLPNELMVKALGPFRELLADTPETWPPITLGDDMEIRTEGRPYALCAESGQWRADVACAVAFARLTGSPLLLIDRFDVLAPQLRGAALGWLMALADDTLQIFVAGTFKAPPAIEGVQTIWLSATNPEEVTA